MIVIIFPLILQTIVTAEMMPAGGEGNWSRGQSIVCRSWLCVWKALGSGKLGEHMSW